MVQSNRLSLMSGLLVLHEEFQCIVLFLFVLDVARFESCSTTA